MIGFVIGVLMIVGALFLGGFALGRYTAPNRGPRKAELARAKKALANLDTIVAEGSLELSMLGSQVAEKASKVLRSYWRGDGK